MTSIPFSSHTHIHAACGLFFLFNVSLKNKKKVDYQINENCSITAAVRNASHLIELGFHFCDFCLLLAAAICLPETSSINKLFRLRWGFIPATVSHLPSLSLPPSLSPSLASSLTQLIVMEIIRSAKPQTKERALTYT